MRFLLLLVTVSFLNSVSAEMRLENTLMPFTTDGCSSFPNGIPMMNEKKWLHCCIQHDIAYWQGGSKEDKLKADQALRNCVEVTGEKEIAELMYWGVRFGGAAGLPTSWGWSYGWIIPRGFLGNGLMQLQQINPLKSLIPENLTEIPLQKPALVPRRKTLAGNYCVDLAMQYLEQKQGYGPVVAGFTEEAMEEKMGEIFKTFRLDVQGCTEPYYFQFLVLRENACEPLLNEILARGRIRLAGFSGKCN